MIERTFQIEDLTPEELAKEVAAMDGEGQGRFFNEMAERFNAFNMGTYGDNDGMQMIKLSSHLSKAGFAFIDKLAHYVKD